jgi:deazaflavin-dependent oxidoreductase (nitroreductase family)
MSSRDRGRRARALVFWRVFNPLARSLAGIAPWWVVLETRGRRSGNARRVPLAAGPRDGQTAWLIAVHGAHASFAYNIAADPRVRLKIRGRWHEGTARLLSLDETVLERFNSYARVGPRTFGIEPRLIRIELSEEGESP